MSSTFPTPSMPSASRHSTPSASRISVSVRITTIEVCSNLQQKKKSLKVYATATVHWVQDHRWDVGLRLQLYGMIYLPSASAMDVRLQSHPPADEWWRQARREGGPGKGRRGKFSWSKVGGMFQSEWDCDRAPRECFPHPGARCGSRRAWKSIASR